MILHRPASVRSVLGALLSATCCVALAQGAAPPPPAAPAQAPSASAGPSEAELLVFQQEHLARLPGPRTLRYAYVEEAHDKPPVHDSAVLTLTAAADGTCCNVHGDYLSGPMTVTLPDIPQAHANPVLLFFLESEVRQLQRVTGGQAPHFRRRIRVALADGARVSDTTIQWNGQAVPARRVQVAPFRDDPYRNRFLQQSQTEYAFVLADAVPGGVYQMSATVPGPAGAAPLERRTLTFDPSN